MRWRSRPWPLLTAISALGALAWPLACGSSGPSGSPGGAASGSSSGGSSSGSGNGSGSGADVRGEVDAESDSSPALAMEASTTSGSSGGSSGSSSGSIGSSSSGVLGDAGTGCPALAGVDDAYARWPMPNPPSAKLPNPFSYTDHGDGTVLDNVTGLVWQKAVPTSQAYAWADAKAYCASLSLAGLTWHLPSRIQLLSLVDSTTGAAMDTTYFSPPGGKYTWSSTPWVVSQIATKPQDAWMVNFGGGGGLTSNAAAQSAVEYTRCVSSPAVSPLPEPHYVQVASGEVQDVETRLVWAQASHTTAVSQADAISYCANLGLNGHAWRLPSINELSTLVDDNPNIAKVSPAIDACVFHDTPANQYYMSSSSLSGTSPWAINYEDGFTDHSQTTGYARCVR
jgi:hypothetical protein